ncbi:GNAT family N-acetyltransferase [Piscinibacter sp.]|jgi:ribosomal-protein-alanine N-acetyltransferase|uniref:GNAT family N-acetyltransferase n=1 Tax=Piscinibacter sp. TaxID=1903157 RepID=UPI001B6D02CC|nr:GNAT family N-acetyltransferase [Piscinibacter sp.]MBK7530886.1 GNAT family N-acetyltransferase [Piscinibacter sp.]MBP6542381.1 GNAT family N-acetyltransferase [Piscinibacter sp.]
MGPALSHFSERHGKEFAEAARRSKSLHGRWVSPPAEASAAAELASRRQGPSDFGFLIFDVASTRIAGYIEITNIVRGPLQSGYLGYYMFKGFEGRGYMKWALATIVKRAWEVHKLHRLEANIQPGNVASIGLVKALGFHQEGYSPRYLKLRGRWRDHERWAVLAR